ncbi:MULTISPECIES: hypothetical protein [Gordonibacter]|uniref:Antitoxin n=1 Tax=Gordonibacter faecis TaxID=3047475 RepID=A0ABT7DSN7_9ACTN|nr:MULTISPECIES: hypothetical protein [unclassified Gordonibacter]MDJ1651541.1 hypothetical protein [Gordonibacter sp. KGMB12511]
MDAVKDGKLTFSRDQIITSSQAAKNFGEARRRAKQAPLYVSDRNSGIDTVIVDYDTFESLAVELEELRQQRFYDAAATRLSQGEADPERRSIALEDVMGEARYAEWLASDPDAVSDEDLFE